MHVLDNPVWHALRGPHQMVAQGGSSAVRYDPAIAPFAGLADEAPPPSWDALRQLVGPGGVAVLVRTTVEPPAGWKEQFRFPTVQMVGTAGEAAPVPGVEILGPADVPDMLELVRLTKPGPFTPRTIELGTYAGLRRDGALVAMAGQRMRLPSHTEISAVCTHPRHRRQGLASMLVRHLVHRIEGAGDTPFLHVIATNTSAVAVYATLGFSIRRTIAVVGLAAPAW